MAYTNIDDPSAYFQTTLYTGNGAAQDITNTGNSDLQPDMVMTKIRNAAQGWHTISDSTRGVSANTGKWWNVGTTQAELDDANGIRAFNTDGFKTGNGWFNGASSYLYVAWQWKCNGGTTASNSDGTITSTVQANTTAGFSIITYTGTGSVGTIGHGLGVAPKMLIVKNRTTALDWAIYHKDLTDDGYVVAFNNTDAQADSGTNRWNHTAPTSSVIHIGAGQQTNQNTNNMVCYAFAPIQGYSKFGSYVGNGHVRGPFIYTGFKPAFLIVKNITNSGYDWAMTDNKRSPVNEVDKYLWPNSTGSEYSGSGINLDMDYLSNGIKLRTSRSETNHNGATFIYMAFAENPFVTSTGISTTARA